MPVGISNFYYMVGLCDCLQYYLLATFTFACELTFTFAICYRPSVCLSSVALVRPTQAVQIIGNISTALGTLASIDISIHKL